MDLDTSSEGGGSENPASPPAEAGDEELRATPAEHEPQPGAGQSRLGLEEQQYNALAAAVYELQLGAKSLSEAAVAALKDSGWQLPSKYDGHGGWTASIRSRCRYLRADQELTGGLCLVEVGKVLPRVLLRDVQVVPALEEIAAFLASGGVDGGREHFLTRMVSAFKEKFCTNTRHLGVSSGVVRAEAQKVQASLLEQG